MFVSAARWWRQAAGGTSDICMLHVIVNAFSVVYAYVERKWSKQIMSNIKCIYQFIFENVQVALQAPWDAPRTSWFECRWRRKSPQCATRFEIRYSTWCTIYASHVYCTMAPHTRTPNQHRMASTTTKSVPTMMPTDDANLLDARKGSVSIHVVLYMRFNVYDI